MAQVTLNDIKVRRTDKISPLIIDGFLRRSPILAAIPFDDCISPGIGGSTMTYGYVRLTSSPAAAGRAIGSDYTPAAAQKTKYSTDLKIMGGSYQIDRVLAASAPDEIAFQSDQKVEATVNRFHWLFVNGNKSVDTEFDGLKTAVNGTSTDFTSSVDASTMSAAVAIKMTEEIDTAIRLMKSRPTMILSNYKGAVKLASAARTLGYLTQTESAFGASVPAYNGIPIVDLGNYYNEDLGSETEIIQFDPNSGKTDFYLVSLDMAGVHGVTISGDKAITARLPKFEEAGAVKTGDVEFVASIAIKNTRSIARIKGVQVQTALSALGSLTLTAAVNSAIVDPAKPKIGNKYVWAKAASTITAPTANTAVNMSVYANLPANGVIVASVNDFVRVVEVYKDSLLPIATAEKQITA